MFNQNVTNEPPVKWKKHSLVRMQDFYSHLVDLRFKLTFKCTSQNTINNQGTHFFTSLLKKKSSVAVSIMLYVLVVCSVLIKGPT